MQEINVGKQCKKSMQEINAGNQCRKSMQENLDKI